MAKRETLTDQQTACFCRGLSLQLHAGISLADGIHLLAADERGAVGERYGRMGAALDQGCQLEEALAESGCFPEYVCGMVKIGQQTGRLEQTLTALGNFYDRQHHRKRQIKNAVSYPAFVFALMLVVVVVLLVKVLPVFDGVYASLGSRLTGVAAGLLQLGRLLEKAMPMLLVVLAACGLMAIVCWKSEPARQWISIWYQKHFGDCGIGRKYNNARFAQALAMGLSSGLTLGETMELAESLLKKIPGAADRCRLCVQMLESGTDLPAAMKESQLLPPAESRMLTAGIRSGNADQVMEEIAGRLQQQAEEALEDLVAKIEPAMVMAASLLVGLILLVVMLPLVNIMSTVG